jgi:cytochrome d ubiquinol oxidase subunit I
MTTEVGRQPWVVYRVMRTDQAVTSASGIPVSYAVLASTYLVLIAAIGWALWRLAATPLPGSASADTPAG